MMRKTFDKGQISEFYGSLLHDGSGKAFIEDAKKASAKARILHFSYLDSFSVKDSRNKLPLLPLFSSPSKKLIMHYHGSDIRGKGKEKREYYSAADIVLVSTRDLLEDVPAATWLPRPVDTDHFKPLSIIRKKRSAVFVNVAPIWLKNAQEFCQSKDLAITIVERKRGYWIPYLHYPRFLNRFEYFLDFKGQKELSKNALEALACGLKVVHAGREGEINFHYKLPEVNRLENVLKKYSKILSML